MRNSAASSISTITVLKCTETSVKMGCGVRKGGGCFCHSNTDHKWGQSLILKVSEHPTTGTFSWPLHSACDYPTAPLFSPWPSRVPQKPHILISFAILTSKVSGTTFLSILARQKGFQVRNPPSRGGGLGFKKHFFFSLPTTEIHQRTISTIAWETKF